MQSLRYSDDHSNSTFPAMLAMVHDLTGNFDGGSLDLFGAQGEFRQRITAGDHWIAASMVRLYEGLPPSYGGPNPSR